METEVRLHYFTQKFSIVKTTILIIALSTILIVPFLPNVSDNLTYMSFAYTVHFIFVLYLFGFIGFLIIAGLTPFLWWAVRKEDVLKIGKDDLTVKGFADHVVRISDINGIKGFNYGNLVLSLKDGNSISLPVFLYDDASATVREIRRLFE